MLIYIYCVRGQAVENRETVFFEITQANDLDRRKTPAITPNPRTLRTVFVLGPFLDRDEAEDVHAQAHSFLAKHRVAEGSFCINPLEMEEFWEWVDAQLLPILVYEMRTRPQQSLPRARMGCCPKVSVEQRAAAEQRKPGSPVLRS